MTRYAICTYWFYLCVTGFLTYYWLSGEWLIILAVLMVVDVVLWITKSWVINKENPEWFSSDKLKVWVAAKVAIIILIILLAIVIGWLYRNNDVTFLIVDVALGLFICAEFVSVVQNTIMIRQQKYIPERDAITAVLWWVLDVFKRFIEKRTNP